jgi:WD40 repeat protein
LIAKLSAHHSSPPNHISVHPSKPLLLTSSKSESILWDTESWERVRVLVGSGSGVQQVFYLIQTSFSPDGVSIIGAFTDGSIFFWTIESFSLLWKISLEQLAGPETETLTEMKRFLSSTRNSHFSISASGEYLAYGGLSSTLYVWNLFEKRLLHEIVIPLYKEKLIIQVDFIGPTNIVILLSSTGEMIFVDVAEAKFVGQIKGRHTFKNVALSPDGMVLSTVLLDAKYIVNMFRIDPFLRSEVVVEDQEPLEETSNEEKSGVG